MKKCILFFLCLIPFTNQAKEKTNVFIDAPINVCWHNGLQYSEGALIKQFDWLYECAARHENEQNGVLIWVKIDNEGYRVIKPKKNTIRVN
ncbi:hypothetical protein PALB_18460 [Pseudoalteromonas luteoviolacea B = ATCC 29581]|nr:hypothetical protein PALB_18460 [Pseudoalteromonas luteoviolacea B = ATCC 29581]